MTHRATVIDWIENIHYAESNVFTRHPCRVALLVAALSAQGESEISNIEQIDRGYENIEGD